MTLASHVMVQDGRVGDSGEETLAVEAGAGAGGATGHATLPNLAFVGPIAGFPEHRDFVLVELEPSGVLCALQSVEDAELRFLVLPPGPFFPDYEPEISDDWAEQLEITRPEEALVLLIITPGASASDATANLFAPIVINLQTRRAAQVMLDDASLPLRAPLRPST